MPIYDDPLESVKSIKKLKAIEGFKVLLAAWDQPRMGDQAYKIIDESLLYLQRIHEAVIKIAGKQPSLDSIELCKRVLKELGLPDAMANPMIARSFQANLEFIDRPDLQQG